MTSLQLKLTSVLLIVGLYCCLEMATAGTIAPSASASRNLFAAHIFAQIAGNHPQQNVVYSPASIQSCLALAFLGAEAQTAQEMRNALQFPATVDKSSIAQDYAEFIKSEFKRTSTDDGPQLRMANRMYVNEALEVSPKFNELATKYFESTAVSARFADSASTVQAINGWVEEQTAGKIKDLLNADSVNGDTSAILVNAIYFKAKWLTPFSASSTHEAQFKLDNGKTVPVQMMYGGEDFGYAELPELQATALEMRYKDSDLSMLILLPKAVDGLQQLEAKLAGVDLNMVAAKLRTENVDVVLPKFRIEYDIDLKEPLKQLGMVSMFSDTADFSSLFVTKQGQKISEVKHKAFLDVNEAGSEAAAATFMKIVPMSLNLNQKRFIADHPFVFAIRSNKAVYFAGHVTKF